MTDYGTGYYIPEGMYGVESFDYDDPNTVLTWDEFRTGMHHRADPLNLPLTYEFLDDHDAPGYGGQSLLRVGVYMPRKHQWCSIYAEHSDRVATVRWLDDYFKRVMAEHFGWEES